MKTSIEIQNYTNKNLFVRVEFEVSFDIQTHSMMDYDQPDDIEKTIDTVSILEVEVYEDEDSEDPIADSLDWDKLEDYIKFNYEPYELEC